MSITTIQEQPIEIPINLKNPSARPNKPRNVTVHCNTEIINGEIIGETTTHLLVTHKTNDRIGEWFAKNGARVHCNY